MTVVSRSVAMTALWGGGGGGGAEGSPELYNTKKIIAEAQWGGGGCPDPLDPPPPHFNLG